MKIHHRTLALLSCLTTLGFAITPPASAQQTSATSSTGVGLEEVIVTAQKRAQNSQDVGIALSAVSGAELDRARGDFGERHHQERAGGRADPAQRPGFVQPLDPRRHAERLRRSPGKPGGDLRRRRLRQPDVRPRALSLYDIDRVEVLRGPQGTLFGRNATGGLANFMTRRPTDDTGGYVNVTFGEYNLTRVEGAVNGAVMDGIDARLSFVSNHYDPLFKNIAGGAPDSENGNDWAVRGQLLFKNLGGGELLAQRARRRQDVHAGAWEEYATASGTTARTISSARRTITGARVPAATPAVSRAPQTFTTTTIAPASRRSAPRASPRSTPTTSAARRSP